MASDESAGEVTSVFRADFVPKPDTWVTAPGEAPPPGSALLVVTRGPNAGSRLVLDKAVTSAGRHPDSDIFLVDVSVSRRHAEFQLGENNDVQVVDVRSLAACTATASRWTPRRWPTATRCSSASSA